MSSQEQKADSTQSATSPSPVATAIVRKASPTPGPWEIHGMESSGSQDISICGRTAQHHNPIWLARVYGQGIMSKDTGARDANAHLIAAAPALLEALRSMIEKDETTSRHDWKWHFDKARAAIALATVDKD